MPHRANAAAKFTLSAPGSGGSDHYGRHQSLHRSDRARLNPKLKIIARASEEDAEKHLLNAGADSVVSPYLVCRTAIAQSFLSPHVVSFLDTATTHLGIDLEIGEIQVPANPEFAGKTLAIRVSAKSAA